MLKIRFSRLPQHRVFDYTPMYYNKEKEERGMRVEMKQRDRGESVDSQFTSEERIRKGFQYKRSAARRAKSKGKGLYALRLVAIIGILMYLFVKFWDNNALETIFGL